MPQGVGSYGNHDAAVESQTSTTRVAAVAATATASKNEIKISAQGVAKLSFSFLEDHHADSSLEPGEVKTPPHSPSPTTLLKEAKAATTAKTAMVSTPAVAHETLPALHNELIFAAKIAKSASQLDAQACQEKVRAILELDAIKRREEADIRKQLQLAKEKEGTTPEKEEDVEKRRLEKEERKRLKKLKKELKAAQELNSENDADGTGYQHSKKKKKKRDKDEDDDESEAMRSIVGAVPYSMGPTGPLPPSHLPPYPDNFMGYRAINPFMRMVRPDFHHQRGGMIGFHPRGRGNMRGAMRFPGFRPPFVHGIGPPRHHTPMQRQQATLPARGHSPILPPNDNLIWTTTKPSISYAFNLRDVGTTTFLHKPAEMPEPPPSKTESSSHTPPTTTSEQRKKSKSSREREKIRNRRTSRNSCEQPSKRKIHKIRKSLDLKPVRKRTKTPELLPKDKKVRRRTGSGSEGNRNLNKKLKLTKSPDDAEKMWDQNEETLLPEEETFQLSKDSPVSRVKDNPSPAFKAKNTSIASDEDVNEEQLSGLAMSDGIRTPEGPALPPKMETPKDSDAVNDTKNFDMFAESPPHRAASPTTPIKPTLSTLETTPTRPTTQDIDKLLLAARTASNKTSEPQDVESVKNKQKLEVAKCENVLERVKELQPGETSKKKGVIKVTDQSSAKIYKRSSTPTKIVEIAKASYKNSERIHKDPSRTPPKILLKPASVVEVIEKTALQKAIEMQSRIDKLLKEDDLDASTISEITAKSLEHKRRKEREALTHYQKHYEVPHHKKSQASESRRSLTPEQPKNIKNPFRRSPSRTRHLRRSRSRTRSRTPKRQHHDNRSTLSKNRSTSMRRSKSGFSTSRSGSRNRSGSGSINRSRSGEGEKVRKKKKSKSPRERREKLNAITVKDKSHITFERKESKHDRTSGGNAGSVRKIVPTKTPLSFEAAEFLFPSEDDSLSQKLPDDEDVKSTKKKQKNAKKSTTKTDKDDSPDTDDYMDNWENEDGDLDVNSNNACDSSTPMRPSSQEEVQVEQNFVARFVNPSPPKLVQQPLEAAAVNLQQVIETTTHVVEQLDKPQTPPRELISIKQEPSNAAHKKDLIGMQEIYDQFIKSVEESGVDLKPNEDNTINNDEDQETPLIDNLADHLSTSSASTSSSTSSSSESSSSETSNSSYSSSSSSSSSASSSEESNDADESFANVTLDSPRPKPKAQEDKVPILVMPEKALTPPLPVAVSQIKQEKDIEMPVVAKPTTPPLTQYVATQPQPASPATPPILHQSAGPLETKVVVPPANKQAAPPLPPLQPQPQSQAQPQYPTKAQKSDVAKDFKKLKSLEANLSRIQMMRANYDSADEISEELLKMEKLFLHEKNLILLKYAKSAATAKEVKPVESVASGSITTSVTPASAAMIPVPSSQDAAEAATEQAAAAAAVAEANKIFDANREAIKLTISPIKLPKTPAIFEKPGTHDEFDSESSKCEAEEADFTEKLQKPAKEVAIVKPMMEIKDGRQSSQQRSRRSTPPATRHTAHEQRSRSPSGSYHRGERRRSTSRTRFSPKRRQRVRSLSVSPPPRRGGSGIVRYTSPNRRAVGNSNTAAASQSRYRNSARRSRSRSRSIPRQPYRRRGGGELSPTHVGRSRRPAGTSSSHSQSTHYRKSAQATRGLRDSRSRSRSRSPPRPHSPRSPPPLTMRRRSYSRDRYSSRSPLPFKPPSPPMRRSLSPLLQRRSSLSPITTKRSTAGRRSPRSHSRSRSPCSPRYEEHRRRRANSYDRRSPSLQREYYMPDPAVAGSPSAASSYYYNLSPNRISLDTRINIVLNGPPNQDGSNVPPSYESYSSYSQYGGQYMSLPPHPDAAGYSLNYGAHQYVHMSGSTHPSPSSSSSTHQPVYSSIPTIGGSGGNMPPSGMHSNYYYNEFHSHPGHPGEHHSTSVLKELPKAAAVAVQKGNVLEIVPSTEISSGNEAVAPAPSHASDQQQPAKKPKKKSVSISWKEEVNNRHITAAVLRLSRENDGASKGILKRSSMVTSVAIQKEEKSGKKKVYFEDGIFPNRDSDDEDRKIIDSKMRRKLRRLQKLHGITINAENLVKEDEIKLDPALENLPPPPPPAGAPPAYLEQPIYLRPPSPTPVLYFHFDSIVHSMYVSQLERPIPPRLLNPKTLPPGAGAATQSPASTQSPNGAGTAITHMIGSKKDLSTLAAINRSNRGTDGLSPKLTASNVPQRRDNLNTIKTMPIETIHSDNTQTPSKTTMQIIPASVVMTPPPHHTSPMSSSPTIQRQNSPIGFMGMRINNFMRLPPSPLTRAGTGMQSPIGSQIMPIVGMRHSFNMPPPTMMHPNGHQHLSPSQDFPPQQQPQYHSQSAHHSMQLPHHASTYPVHQQPLHPHQTHFSNMQHPPPTAHTSSHLHLQRQQTPQFYVQALPPPPLPQQLRHVGSPLLVTPTEVGLMQSSHGSAGLEDANAHGGMMPSYNLKRQ